MNEKTKKKNRGSRGTVTVFLTLVLVPCIIFVCAFGDVSRVVLSKSQAVSSADLAMYSLLSNYDEDLKEWYGLVASCQNISDFYSVTASYFDGMMSAAGIDGTASELFTSYLSSLETGSNFADFLQVEITGTTTVTAVDNSSLENVALLEDEIVEFMKYRGPVEIFENLIDRLTDMDLTDDLNDTAENEPIVEAKQEYAEAEGELLEAALYTYVATLNYQNYYTANGIPSTSTYNTCATELKNIYSDLGSVTELITKYYAFTSDLKNLKSSFTVITSLPTVTESGTGIKTSYNGTNYTPTTIGAELNEEGTGYTLDEEAASALVEDYKTWISNVKNNASNIVTACSGITSPSSSSDINPAVYLMKMQNAMSTTCLTAISANAKKLITAYAKILLALECDMDDSSKQSLESARDNIEELWTNYLTYTSGQNTDYEKILYQYQKAADTSYSSIKNQTYTFSSAYCGSSVTVSEFFSQVKNDYSTLTSKLQTQLENLNIILNGGDVSYDGKTYHVQSLSQVRTLLEEYIEKRDDWGDAAHGASTSYAVEEQAEYDGGEENALARELAEKGVSILDDFETRLTNIKGDIEDLLNALNNFKHGGKTVTSLTGATAITAAKTVIPTSYTEISTSLAQNKTDAANYAKQLISPSSSSDVYTAPSTVSGETGNQPDLEQDNPTFYVFMKENLGEDIASIGDEIEKNDSTNESNQSQADTEEASSKETNASYITGVGSDTTLPSDSGDTFGASEVLGGLAGLVTTLTSGNYTEIRDRLYVVEYAMDMFSYSSFNNEGMYALNGDNSYTHTQFVSNGYSYPSAAKTAWNKVSATEVDGNQSLTNRPINANYNQMNLAEIEYILYGKSTISENLNKSYNKIFALRETLNLVSGFQNFYTLSTTTGIVINGIADMIQGLTMGVVPAALTKCIIIGVLATLETSYDLCRLKAGLPVVLYKAEEENWYYKVSGAKSASFSGGSSEPVDENGLFYSDYLYFFLLLGAQDSGCYEGILTRIGNLVEINMIKQGESSFKLSNALCYFKLTSTLRVKPLLLTLPIVSNYSYGDGTSATTVTDNTDWCTYEVSVIRGYS